MAKATDANQCGHRQEYINKKTLFRGTSGLSCRKSRKIMNSNNGKLRTPYPPPYPPQQANMREVDDVVDVDDIIDYTMLNHEATEYSDNDKGSTTIGVGVLAYIACCSSSAADIHTVMAMKTKIPHKGKSRTGTNCEVNASKLTASTIQGDDNTYYLNKGKSIKVAGHQYFAHSTNISYWIVQHDVGGMEYALFDCGANSGVCGDDILVVEVSERFVDVSGLAGYYLQ
jgi:hypothetical protein